MALMNPAQNLIQEFLNDVWTENTVSGIVSPVGDDVTQISVAVLEDQVNFIDLRNDVVKFYQIWVINLVELF